MRNILKAAAVVAAASLMCGVAVSPAQAATYDNPTGMSYVVVPHPDDEWQAWSLIENSPANYKVFITMTDGEQSGYCDSPHPGGPTPNPVPPGKWTPGCAEARMNSWLGFFTKMSTTDPTIPGEWVDLGYKGHFPDLGIPLRTDDGGSVTWASRKARVWVDAKGKGAAINFDLGDGDLTAKEVEWAVKTVLNNRTALGINDSLPNWNILGSFAHSGSYGTACAKYAHPDHYAVHAALYNVNYGTAGYQTAATCAADPDAVRTKVVGQTATETAWSGTESGFKQAYGWLGPYVITYYQDKIFMRTQSFWQRF